MIPFLAVAVIFFSLSVLIHRHRVRERRRDLLVMKRHAANYSEQVESRLAG